MSSENNVINLINNSKSKVCLDVGCGNKKISPDHIGIDIINTSEVDLEGDYKDIFKKINSEKIDEIYSSHFLEHIDDLEHFILESSRILKKGGKAILKVPHFSNPYFYSDPTHVRFFGLYTFCYFAKCSFLRRTVPQYEHSIDLRLNNIKINFKSTPPFYFRHAFKRVIYLIVNSSNYSKEFWEENLCYILPAYELKFELEKI